VKVEWVERAAALLMKHMMLFFAPLIVGVLGMTALLAESWLPLVATMVISTLVTLAVTAGVAAAVRGEPDE
jgi:holin-like protein